MCWHALGVGLPFLMGKKRRTRVFTQADMLLCTLAATATSYEANSMGAKVPSRIKQECLQQRHDPELAQVLQQLGKLLACLRSQHKVPPACAHVKGIVAVEK